MTKNIPCDIVGYFSHSNSHNLHCVTLFNETRETVLRACSVLNFQKERVREKLNNNKDMRLLVHCVYTVKVKC